MAFRDNKRRTNPAPERQPETTKQEQGKDSKGFNSPKVGALWKSKSGKALVGSLELDGRDGEKVRIFITPNKFKDTDKHPDYIIFLSEELQGDDPNRGQAEPPKADGDIPF